MPPEIRSFEQDREICKYYREDFFAELGQGQELAKRSEQRDHCQRIELYQGMTLPDELRQLLTMRDDYAFEVTRLADWHILDAEFALPDPARGNLGEQLIVADQKGAMATALLEYFAWCVRIGRGQNGDVYFATFDKRQPDNCEVIFLDHQERQMPFYIADSISSLAYANHLLAALARDEVQETRQFKKKAKRLKKRTRLPEAYQSLERAGKFEGEYEGHDVTRYLYYRSYWIVRLLQNTEPSDAEELEALFSMVDVPWSDLEDAVKKGTLAQSPPAAFYWLWRCFFFGREDSLQMLVERCRQGENPLIDDMASLVEEIQAGRGSLGTIEDIHQVRDAFMALQLDQESAE